ncbi:hypothetical protein [Kitasatospora sp. A2-31]|uniref:hypothetical protein n=1 Tax=Kitasatospora sp. A2-31 TaxID=2916414 RepID=UPI001EEB46B9|nr:hypothetical protein [Kitasatospora sp. A2-31]MCG6498592.1 hypothetical protein [Kitasatospora sp. A2-31]
MTSPQEQQGRPAEPEQRSGRHAARRTPVRARLRGRALAMAAVPTALLMAATYTPNAAVAEPAAGKPCASAPDTPVQPPAVAETPVPKSELPPPLPGPSVPLPADPTTAPAAPSTASSAPTAAPKTPAAPTSGPISQAPAPASSPASAPVRSAAVEGSGKVVQAGLIDDVVGGITNLLNPSASPSPSASTGSATAAPTAPSATTAPAAGNRAAAAPAAPAAGAPAPAAPVPSSAAGPAPAAAPSGHAAAAPDPTASASPGSGKTAAKPSAGARATGSAAPSSGARTPSASASPSADPNCLVPLKGLSAGETPDNPILVPDQNWTLQTSRLTLNHAVLMGVVKVQTPTGTKRVLKFVVDSVDIENLDMSTLEGNGRTFHVKGAPGSVSTMRKGPVTMYVERMSGHLSKVLGLPVPIDLGELTLTPDGPLPQWLYDLIGKLEIPLWLEMTGVTAVQAGQFGGTLKIPGMRLYNDDTPYVGNR